MLTIKNKVTSINFKAISTRFIEITLNVCIDSGKHQKKLMQ